ncbi:MAG: S-layer homology domain-containing protein [Acidobacteriota bacterium]
MFPRGKLAVVLGLLLLILVSFIHSQSSKANSVPDNAALIAEGRNLFFEETFDGNGRTCGTCHAQNDSFGLSPTIIASVPSTDLLFVAEFNSSLAALEHPPLMRGPRGLILENIDGFSNPNVFRGSPHLLNIALTAPYGLSGEIPNLREFSVGAVKQHFPKTMNRVEGVDFRLPTTAEQEALEAFMLSIFFPADQNFALERFVTTNQQRRGGDLFFGTAKCSQCHNGPVLSTAIAALGGGNQGFATGVVNLAINIANDPNNPGGGPLAQEAGGLREFSTPPLFGIGQTAPFFHDNSVATLRDAVAFYDTSQFGQSPSALLVGGLSLTQTNIDDVTSFLNSLKEFSFSVSPRFIAFGPTAVSAGSTISMNVTITNNGAVPLNFTGIGMAGGPSDSQFVLVGSPLTSPLAAGDSRQIAIAFDPSTVGLKVANLEFKTDAGDAGAALFGVGTSGMPTFADVPADHFAFRFIEGIFNAGVTSGCSTNPVNFCPDGVVTRAQAAILLVRALGLLDVPPRGVFGDVSSTSFGAGFIERLAERGITSGCGSGNFCPNNPVTREHMAVFIIKAMGETPVASPSGLFSDVPPGHPLAGFIERMAQLGITSGCGGGQFCPNAPVTRAQSAIFIARAFNLPLP